MSQFIKQIELLEPYDAKVSRTVLRGERGSNASDLPDKRYYDALKAVNNLVKDARKVQQTVLLVGEISDIYVNSFQKMLTDGNYTPDELSAIASGYAKMLEESSGMLNEMKIVVTSTGLSMTDKERMDVIDRVYCDVKNQRNLVRYYTNRNIGISYLRAKKKNDTQRVLDLYGTDNQKYW